MAATKQENIQFFVDQLPTLLADPLKSGKFVVVHDRAVRGAFDTFEAALRDAVAKYPANEFVVQQVISGDARISFIRAAS